MTLLVSLLLQQKPPRVQLQLYQRVESQLVYIIITTDILQKSYELCPIMLSVLHVFNTGHHQNSFESNDVLAVCIFESYVILLIISDLRNSG